MKFQCENQNCSLYKVFFDLNKVKLRVIKDEVQYFEDGERILCKECGEISVKVEPEIFKGFAVSMGSFDSKTPSEKREILKKREKFYSKKDKVFKEYKQFKDNGGID